MAWKKVSTTRNVEVETYADVDATDIDEAALLQALIYAKWLSEDEASAILSRAKAEEKNKNVIKPTADIDEFALATDLLRSGLRSEAIIHVERFLGRDWIGVLQ